MEKISDKIAPTGVLVGRLPKMQYFPNESYELCYIVKFNELCVWISNNNKQQITWISMHFSHKIIIWPYNTCARMCAAFECFGLATLSNHNVTPNVIFVLFNTFACVIFRFKSKDFSSKWMLKQEINRLDVLDTENGNGLEICKLKPTELQQSGKRTVKQSTLKLASLWLIKHLKTTRKRRKKKHNCNINVWYGTPMKKKFHQLTNFSVATTCSRFRNASKWTLTLFKCIHKHLLFYHTICMILFQLFSVIFH